MRINGRLIGTDYKPYVIAEISANHNGQLENAFSIIDMAKNCGADAVKIQTYLPDSITLNMNTEEFMIRGGLWDGKSLYELYEEAHLPWAWHKPLFEYANKKEITIFSSPFDRSAVDLLEDLNTPAYKIASFEAIDLPLIRYCAATGKPLIISTGLANKSEIREAIETAYDGGCKELAILHCVSGYPSAPSDYKLNTITDMIKEFDVVVGLSDHTLSNVTAVTSVGLGASIIEKHVTLDRSQGGPDDSFSIEANELMALVADAKIAHEALGDVDYGLKSSERSNIKYRRSLYFVENLSKGDVLTEKAIKSVRPGYGLAPKYFDELIGRKLQKDINANSPVTWDAFNE